MKKISPEIKLDLLAQGRIQELSYCRRIKRNRERRIEQNLERHKKIVSHFHRLNEQSFREETYCIKPEGKRWSRRGKYVPPDTRAHMNLSPIRRIWEEIDFFGLPEKDWWK